MKSLFKNLMLLVAAAGLLTFTSCRDDEFDAPPAGGTDPNLVANTTIADLKAGYVYDQFDTIKTDKIISGVVTADDKSGNFYKTIIIQDETAAIAIRIDVSDYYTKYPIGRRVFVKCRGLVIGDYNNLIQLGGFIDYTDPVQPEVEPIPFSLVDRYLVPGVSGLVVAPKVVTINQVSSNQDSSRKYQNMLIRFNGVEFISSDTAKTYADVVNQQSANRKIKDCGSGQIDIRTSNYSNFGGANLPNGNGSLTAIFSVFGSSPQLAIRDLNDVKLDTARCGTGGGGTTTVSIATARGYFTGTTTTAPAGKKIVGIVISSRAEGNIVSQNLVIQDATAGIVVRFTANHSFDPGDQIEIDISNQELSEFSGLLQVNNVPNASATKTGTGTITPAVVTIADINANSEAWESTLVKVENTTITGGTTYSGSKTMNDGTGTITLFTRSQATFATATVPTGSVDVTAIVSQFNTTKQLNIRNLADVQ
jgi:hypothetical protein